MQFALAVIALVAVLVFAVVAPRGLPEATVAVPGALLLLATGTVSVHAARQELGRLGSTIGFLAAVLVLAYLCDVDGLFAAAGRAMGRACRGDPAVLLGLVFVVASVVTAVLSLDTTVVLLTPVVLATASEVRVRARPHVYACAHLSNSASLLLPVSNLTNLLAFSATGLTFLGFAERMAVPWVVAVGVEYVIFRFFFARDLRASAPDEPDTTPLPDEGVPVFTIAVVGLTLAGFAATSFLAVAPAWVAAAGATVLAVRALVVRSVTPLAVARSASVTFLLFVIALAVIVRGVSDHGLSSTLRHVVPSSTSLGALLLTATVAAVLANLVNNLPAVLALLPAVDGRPALVLAVLLGVNIGPNLTYIGSLATLLWRRSLRDRGVAVGLGEFSALAVLTVPPTLAASVVALWGVLRLTGT